MLDFDSVREGKLTYNELTAGLTRGDLRDLTNEMIDSFLAQISECTDADVTFQPVDPKANDQWAVEGEVDLAWNLGHVIVHTTVGGGVSSGGGGTCPRSRVSRPISLRNAVANGDNHRPVPSAPGGEPQYATGQPGHVARDTPPRQHVRPVGRGASGKRCPPLCLWPQSRP